MCQSDQLSFLSLVPLWPLDCLGWYFVWWLYVQWGKYKDAHSFSFSAPKLACPAIL